MIDILTAYQSLNLNTRVEALAEEILKVVSLEGGADISEDPVRQLPKKYLSKLNPQAREALSIAYSQAYSGTTKNHPLIKKYLPGKSGGSGKKPGFADLFSGAGGLGLGLENSGFRPLFISDYQLSALETYYFNRNLSLKNYYHGDIRKLVNGDSHLIRNFSDAFLVAGGPPCQGFSMANRQRLLDDPRNELYKDFLLILKEVRPPFFLLENVRGMARKREEVEKDMKQILGTEYSYCFLILNARDYNIPQNRERFFIIGNRIGVNPENIALSIKSQATGTKFSLRNALEGLPEIETGTEFNRPFIENDQIGYKIRKYSNPETAYSRYLNGSRKQEYLFNHKSRFNNENDREIFRRLPQGGDSSHESIQDILKYKNRKDIFKDKYYRLLPDKVCKAITSHMRFDCHMYIHPWQARGLSPREAARIQTFPDDYVFMGRPNEWYQQIGNAVPVKLAEMLGKEIMKYWK